jgi:hypothetical protein
MKMVLVVSVVEMVDPVKSVEVEVMTSRVDTVVMVCVDTDELVVVVTVVNESIIVDVVVVNVVVDVKVCVVKVVVATVEKAQRAILKPVHAIPEN